MIKMKDLEKVFGKFKSGVYVITTIIDDVKYGWTISWVSKISFDPPLVMISVGKNKKDNEKFMDAEVFAINVLGENGLEIGRHFGLSSGDNINNFNGMEVTELETGSPVFKDIVGAVDCKVVKTVDAGDHTVFIGEVLDSISKEGESLVFDKKDFP